MKSFLRAHLSVVIAILALVFSAKIEPLFAQQLVTLATSNFEIDADGWHGTNDLGASEAVTYKAGGATSNSVGYISIAETTQDSTLSFFTAPAKFLGDKRAAYNGFLTFYFRQNKTANLSSANRFVVLGSGTNFLSYDLSVFPNTSWNYYSLQLNENSGWHFATTTNSTATSNQLATKDDVIRILSALTTLRFKAEYSSNNGDVDDLDDVTLLGLPSGSAQANLGINTYAVVTIDGAVGSTYRIDYRDVLDTSTNWLTLTNLVLPSSPYLFIDTNSPSAQARFYRAVLSP